MVKKTAPRRLFGSEALSQWIRQGGRPDQAIIGHRAQLWWQAHWFEFNWRQQTRRLSPVPLPDDPVFILGLWRCGTTVLHELLTAATGWVTPKTWQCFNPSTCFLTGAPQSRASVERPMDRGQITSHGPQEDEFALLLLGGRSAYRGFIDPRRLGECVESLASPSPNELDRWQDFVRGLVTTDPSSRLLLKSPGHSFRVPLLSRLFPRGKFVFIGRHTGEVLESNMRMWRAMMDTYALWGCPQGALEDFLRQALGIYARVLEHCVDEMPRERMLWVDFDALRSASDATLRGLLQFLQVPDAEIDGRVRQALTRVSIHAGRRAELPAEPMAQQLEKLMDAARRRFSS